MSLLRESRLSKHAGQTGTRLGLLPPAMGLTLCEASGAFADRTSEDTVSRTINIRERLPNDAAWIFGISCTAYTVVSLIDRGFGVDAHAYWLAWQGPMYTTAPGTPDAYLYSPAFAQAIWPLAQLRWPAFATVVIVGVAVLLAWLLRPLPWRWAVPLWLAGLPEITSGNIFIILATAAVLGFKFPVSWALPALTKVTPAVGPIWFLARREWHQLLITIFATVAVALASLAVSPDLWRQWYGFLSGHLADSTGPIGSAVLPPAVIRIPLGVALIIWGALRNERWTVPLSMLLCSPVLWLGSLTLLAAIPRLRLSQGQAALPDLLASSPRDSQLFTK